MKRVAIALSTLGLSITLIGANNHVEPEAKVTAKRTCLHYTIIEFGKGVDCNGDTVKLVKVNGVQVLASQVKKPLEGSVAVNN